MQIKNIDRILIFREEDDGRVLGLDELNARYGIDADGTNFYYGINEANVEGSAGLPSALNPTHRAFFNAILNSLQASKDDEKTVVLGVEPQESPDPYGYVSSSIDLVDRLAADMNDLQNRARSFGKRLNIVVRYASEMNDRSQVQGKDPSGYRRTFVQARESFSAAAPGVLFSFSPALRADLREDLIDQYWPGDRYVDIIGGTWYIGGPDQTAKSVSNMRAYFVHRLAASKPFAISEVGGHDGSGKGNDGVLEQMLHEMETLQLQGVAFKYATMFLQKQWGTDATLKFLRPSP